MLNLFRYNTLTAIILGIIITILFRLKFLLYPVPYTFMEDAFLSNVLFGFISSFPGFTLISYIIALILVIIQAMLLNYTVSKHDILYKDTFLPGLCFILLNSLYPEQFRLTPQLISSTFLILVFQRLCYLYESPKPLLLVFDSGMFLGMAIMFNYEVAIFLPYILISVVVFTSFNLRYIVISLLGIMLPMYFVFVFYYMTNRIPDLIEGGRNSFTHFQFKPVITSYENFAPWFIIAPLAFLGIFNLQGNYFRNKVKTRRILQSMAVLGVFCIFSVFTEVNGMQSAVTFLSIPLSIVMGYYLISTKRFWLKEAMVYAIVIIAAYLQIK